MSDQKDDDIKKKWNNIFRKLIRTVNKIGNFKKVFGKFAKKVSIEDSVRRTNKCISNKKDRARCIIAETSNQLVRRGVQAIGTTAIISGAPLAVIPSGVTQIAAGAMVVSGTTIIYNADDYGNNVGEMVENIDFSLNIVKELGNNVKELGIEIKNKLKRNEEIPKENVNLKKLFEKFHPTFFDGKIDNSYMKNIPQIRHDPQPNIEILSRKPDVSFTSVDDFSILIPLLTIQMGAPVPA